MKTIGPSDYEAFLSSSLYYPASDLDPTPLAHTPTPAAIRNFVYADYGMGENRDMIGMGFSQPFGGYKVLEACKLQPRDVLGYTWRELRAKHASALPGAFGEDWVKPCIYFFHLLPEATAANDQVMASEVIRLMFIRLEGVAVYRELYVRRGVAPICLANLRNGVGSKGGGFPEYPALLSDALMENPAGLPEYFLNEEKIGGALPIADAYATIKRMRVGTGRWGMRHLTFREVASQAEQAPIQMKG